MSHRENPSGSLSDSSDWGEATWTDSTIFGLGSYRGSNFLDHPDLDLADLPMDESRLRLAASVFLNAHDGIMITDHQGRILDVNRAYARLTGFAPEEVIGRNPNILKSGMHTPEFYAGMWRALAEFGVWRGEIINRRKNGDLFTELASISAVRDAAGQLTHYVATYTDISALKESQQKLEHLAYHDALTGLPNRVLLGDRIQQALAQARRNKRVVAVCFMDLDDFKPVNDTFGHQVGDQLLIEVAKRLKESVREADTVARLGGDEFALLLGSLDSAQEGREVLGRLLTRIAQPYTVDRGIARISASIGYTLVPGDEGDPDTLLRHADQAMYLAKQGGRNRVVLYDIQQDQRSRSLRENLLRIKTAFAEGEFCLYYQPKVDMRRGKVVGLEALIRWRHPDEGLLLPADFLFELSSDPILVDIGEWAIRTALSQMREWQKAGLSTTVSVNIAGSHLLHPEFSARLAAALADFPEVAPHYLELEILEAAALEDVNLVSRVMNRCRELGVDFALDDFGTGYSSLLYLKRLPAKTLKIDQSFVREMLESHEGADAFSGIVGLASAFKRQVVAEGMEFVEQGIVLLRFKCDVAQGFAISRPMPAEEVVAWVEAYRPDPAWRASLVIPWRRSDFPLLVAEVEQRRWLRMVEVAVSREDAGVLLNRIGNLHESSFGHWLFGLAASRYGNLPEFANIAGLYEQAHAAVLAVGASLLAGDKAAAVTRLQAQRKASASLIDGLMALRRAIADYLKKQPPTAL